MMGSESTVDIIRIGIDKIELRVSIFLWNIEGNDGLQKNKEIKIGEIVLRRMDGCYVRKHFQLRTAGNLTVF